MDRNKKDGTEVDDFHPSAHIPQKKVRAARIYSHNSNRITRNNSTGYDVYTTSVSIQMRWAEELF